jgi:hypothetical protein
MYSITEQPHHITLTEFPKGYYMKAGFYMFFGWLWASVVLWIGLAFAFVFLVAVGVISGGFLTSLFRAVR